MKILRTYDQWCYECTELLLIWLKEWFSLSQKTVERSMIVLYVFFADAINIIIFPAHWYIYLTYGICIVPLMWILHLRPEAMRKGLKTHYFSVTGRIVIQFIFVLLSMMFLTIKPYKITIVFPILANIIYIVFYYMVDISSGGNPGRRCKLAWAELKKLFGTEWIPKTVPIPEH